MTAAGYNSESLGRRAPAAAAARDGINDIARRLDDLLQTMADLPSPPPGFGRIEVDVLEAARAAWTQERQRERIFGLSLLANPGWDILLQLFIAREEGRDVSVETLSQNSGAPELSLVRCIAHLIETGLVIRQSNRSGSGAPALLLSNEGLRLMCNHFTRVEADRGAAGV